MSSVELTTRVASQLENKQEQITRYQFARLTPASLTLLPHALCEAHERETARSANITRTATTRERQEWLPQTTTRSHPTRLRTSGTQSPRCHSRSFSERSASVMYPLSLDPLCRGTRGREVVSHRMPRRVDKTHRTYQLLTHTVQTVDGAERRDEACACVSVRERPPWSLSGLDLRGCHFLQWLWVERSEVRRENVDREKAAGEATVLCTFCFPPWPDSRARVCADCPTQWKR